MKKVAVVVLNYKVKDQAIKCIKSVEKSLYGNINIIAVDNNSKDGFGESVAKIPGVFFIQTGKNLGYAGGNNIGIKKALSDGADYVFVLNPDTTVDEQAIGRLLVICEEEGIGIVGPKILFTDKKTIWYGGGIFDAKNVLGSHRGLDEEDKDQYNKVEETDFVTGGAMFVKKEVFEKIGFFDERFFLYLEDIDFCYRAKRAGFKLMYIPMALVYHRIGQSTGVGSPLQDYYITRSRMLFAKKYLSPRTQLAILRETARNFRLRSKRVALFDFLTGDFGVGGI